MQEQLTIRDEEPADAPDITEVTVAAFADVGVSNQTEHLVVLGLRAAGALTVSLVAELAGRTVGHIAFSPVTISDGTAGWYALGPVSVLPAHQGDGIGAALIEEGLARLRELGAAGCCLVGHPEYYPRFGFANTSELTYEGAPPEVFFVLPFDQRVPRGLVSFHGAFAATD